MKSNKEPSFIIIDPNKEKSSDLKKILNDEGVKEVEISPHYKIAQDILEKKEFQFIVIGEDFLDSTAKDALVYLLKNPKIKQSPIWLHNTHLDEIEITNLLDLGLSGVISSSSKEETIRNILATVIQANKKDELLKKLPQLILQVSYFSHLNQEEVSLLLKEASPITLKEKDSIILKGDTPDKLSILLQGEAIEYYSLGEKNLEVTLSPEDIIGLNSVLNNKPQETTISTTEQSIILQLPSSIITNKNSKFHSTILTHACKQISLSHLTLINLLENDESISEESNDSSDIKNPFSTPTGHAEEYDKEIDNQEKYDVLHRKINLRSEFIVNKIPQQFQDLIRQKLCGYWTGQKLAKMNPHCLWSSEDFTSGTFHLKNGMHIVVLCNNGLEAYQKGFLNLNFSQRVVSFPQIESGGSLLFNEDSINRYFEKKPQNKGIEIDYHIPLMRYFSGKVDVEYLTHTCDDVRNGTLFLVFDSTEGKFTDLVRNYYPSHQIITVIKGKKFSIEDLSTVFTQVEEELIQDNLIVSKKEYKNKGFYLGETFFLPDLSFFYENTNLSSVGYIFGMIGLLAQMGPDYSGISWGSKGGAEGIAKASRAMYGIKGAQTNADISKAIQWADE